MKRQKTADLIWSIDTIPGFLYFTTGNIARRQPHVTVWKFDRDQGSFWSRREGGNQGTEAIRRHASTSCRRPSLSGRTSAARREVNWTLIVAAWIASFAASYRLREQKKIHKDRKKRKNLAKVNCGGAVAMVTALVHYCSCLKGERGGGWGGVGGSEGGMEGGWGVQRQIFFCVNYSRSNNSMRVRTQSTADPQRKRRRNAVGSQMLSIASDAARLMYVLCTKYVETTQLAKVVAPWWPWSDVSFRINQYTCNGCR